MDLRGMIVPYQSFEFEDRSTTNDERIQAPGKRFPFRLSPLRPRVLRQVGHRRIQAAKRPLSPNVQQHIENTRADR